MPAVNAELRISELADELEREGVELSEIVEALDAVKAIMEMRADEASGREPLPETDIE